ncbi:uncharacterized protein LOC129285423 [Prosopis cineraria]|uniref:uncharacterized protein LOC129285423 n=1 Tax=Prosopis cineraria TaxID=364024 RepID=UPI00240EAC01|nr:uncharacterized protein LOC129285423 [Prosopis cineraria]XP_054777098.1 uncharacterized protein LOC129285423 [Prosopis cineraria]XP_054777099.1 uncharacterized protein LOC129285423 [Prosopis cineraria]
MMDFDEYEYLEKTVENPELQRKEKTNGSDGTLKAEQRDHSRSSKHKASEKHHDVDRHSKKLKFGDDSHGYDNHKERGSSRHRSPSRDGDKEKDQHRSFRDNRDRVRDHERDKEEKYSRERDRHQEHARERERDKRDWGSEIERERERDHSRRSRSISERHRSDLDERYSERSRDRDRERSQDKDHRDRERERESKERDRDSRRQKEKKEEVAEPEADPERDQRTVFAYQISLKADERDVYEFFSRAGKVRDVRLIMDRISRRSKGVGYIEFYDVMSVPMAIALSGQPLLGQPVMVKPSEAEKNLVQSATSISSGSTGLLGPYSGGVRRLYVGNLHFSITEADLRRVFEAFGQVELVQLPLDEAGHCKGFGFVQFACLEDARNAQSLNGQLEIGGRTIKVSAVIDQTGMQEVEGNTGDLDDDDNDGGGLSLNACSRALLMQKLDRSGTGSGIAGSLGNSVANNIGLKLPATAQVGASSAGSLLVSPIASVPSAVGLPSGSLQIPAAAATIPTIDTIGVPSGCLLLKNMFDPKDEKEPDFDLDIKEDVEAECSKFGKLKHVYVDKNSAGFVYLKFENTQAAILAQRSLHGRWFAGKMITASFMVPQVYEDKFQDSR